MAAKRVPFGIRDIDVLDRTRIHVGPGVPGFGARRQKLCGSAIFCFPARENRQSFQSDRQAWRTWMTPEPPRGSQGHSG